MSLLLLGRKRALIFSCILFGSVPVLSRANPTAPLSPKVECAWTLASEKSERFCLTKADSNLWEDAIKAWIPIILSSAALLYTMHSNSISRRRSIKDEFWIRTVAWKVSIDPMLIAFEKLNSSIPESFKSLPECEAGLRTYSREIFTSEIAALRKLSRALGFLSQDLTNQIDKNLDLAEDGIAKCIQRIVDNEAVTFISAQRECRRIADEVNLARNRVLDAILKYQLAK